MIFGTVDIEDCQNPMFIGQNFSQGDGYSATVTSTLAEGTYAAFVAAQPAQSLPCGGTENDYTIELTCDDPSGPFPGDGATCETAAEIEIGETIGYDNSDNEQVAVPDCGAGVPTGPVSWFKVTGDGTTLTASTCSDGTLSDTVLAILCDSCEPFGCIGANDDSLTCIDGNIASSEVEWCSEQSTTYWIAIWGVGGSTGNGELTVTSDNQPCGEPTVCESTLEEGDCTDFVTGNNSEANLETGLRPNDSVGGWGEVGMIEDIIVTDNETITDIHLEFLDLNTPLGEPSGITQMQVRIYTTPVEELHPVFSPPPIYQHVFEDGVDATVSDTGADFENDKGQPIGDVEAWDLNLDVELPDGEYTLFITFPGLGQEDYFWASGEGTDFSPKNVSPWGVAPGGIIVLYDSSFVQDSTFCISN